MNPDAKDALPEVRRLLAERKYPEAAKLVDAKVMSKPLGQMPYETVGDLALTFPEVDSVENYRRDLDLTTATAHVTFTSGGVTFSREVFASAPDQVIAVRLTASRPGQISFEARMQTPQRATVEATADGDLVMRGVNGDGAGTTADGRPMTGALRFEARVRVVTSGGTRSANGDAVVVRDADAVTLLIAAATSYRTAEDVSADPAARVAAALDPASRKSIDTLRAAHVRDYQQLFNRVTLDLGASKRVPTDERVRGFADGDDPGLAALYFQYGRYLLIASSRSGSQPANLQGLWNESMSPPWGSKYTININTEMNYWPALSTNLAETMDPLTAMVSDLSVTGARTAREMYGAGGWVAHHNTDLWRATGPIDGSPYGMWPTGGAWLTLPLWDRYEYTGDREYLKRIYPLLKGAAQFFVDTLVEEPTHHWLVTSPSLSPENAHPFGASLVMGPTMDEAILRELFADAIEAARTLGTDAGPAADVERDSGQAGAATDRQRRPVAGMARRLGHAGAGDPPPARVAPVRSVPRARHRRPPDARAGGSRETLARDPRRSGDGLGHRVADQPLGEARRRQPRVRHPEVPARPRAHLSQHVRRAPAVSDRRQLRRHVGSRRDAVAVRRGRDSTVAGASGGVAGRSRHGPESARRVRGRSGVAARRTRARDHSVVARTAAACAPRQHAAHLRDRARCNAHAGRR